MDAITSPYEPLMKVKGRGFSERELFSFLFSFVMKYSIQLRMQPY